MNRLRPIGVTLVLLCIGVFLPSYTRSVGARELAAASERAYLGYDRNVYPGDPALSILRKTFAFSGYWLSPSPGEKTNTWLGKRELLRSQGFGFLVLYRGRDSGEIKSAVLAKSLGNEDARGAASAAEAEGFSRGTIIFLDIEEGGRLPATYHAYLREWIEELFKAGYRAGVYCSGIPVKEEPTVTITTADDIRNNAPYRDIIFWVYNDACPPSPGCAFPQDPPAPSAGGIPYAAVWQFAQSPRRREFTSHCRATYHRGGNCYAPGDSAHSWFLDVNAASSADPSSGAK
ncbi:MAG TPA: glycoside hydrolase domain-containing protein [Candidatus Udaeobacter sp.]|nr:glycoside hydrolase domain-containing protein [Candidatus Udaeobacter sp.]